MSTVSPSNDSKANDRSQTYEPNLLLDALIKRLNLKNDSTLSRVLDVAPPVISKIRHRRLSIGASLLIRMHEVSGLSIAELRSLMRDRRVKFRNNNKREKTKERDVD